MTLNELTAKALEAFWNAVLQEHPQGRKRNLSPFNTERLQTTAERVLEQWLIDNVPPTAEEIRERDAAIDALFSYLDNHHVELEEFGCFVAVDEDRSTLFWCDIQADGSPQRYERDPRHMDWGEVTAPLDQEYLDAVNEVFRTTFKYEQFAGR